MAYRAVSFDLGGVVLDSPLHAIARYEQELGIPAGFVNRVVIGAGPAGAWQRLERLPKYEILSEPRKKAFRFKEQIVIQKEFKNQVLVGEDIAEIDYQPHKCSRKYRLVIVRKNISVQKGE